MQTMTELSLEDLDRVVGGDDGDPPTAVDVAVAVGTAALQAGLDVVGAAVVGAVGDILGNPQDISPDDPNQTADGQAPSGHDDGDYGETGPDDGGGDCGGDGNGGGDDGGCV